MRRVLIVTYLFPPRHTIGSVRLGGLAKYLPEFGWEPIILTAELPGDPDPRFEVIQTQYHDVLDWWKRRLGLKPDEPIQQQLGFARHGKDGNKFIEYILTLGRDIIAYPDPEKGWYRFAVEAGNKILWERNIDAIISSSMPATSHLIAKEFKIRWNIPWIADLRDLWTQDRGYSDNHSFLRRLFEKRLELRTLSKADALVTVSKPWVEALKVLHRAKPVYEITNGFDPAELAGSSKLTDKFTITHSGSLYNCLRDPSNLFEAMRDLISEGAVDASDVQIRFYGVPEQCLERIIEQYDMRAVAKQYGLVSRKTSLEKQRESQLLLLLNWGDREDPGVYTGKLFEYLAAQRPILSTGKGGVIKELLDETGAGAHLQTVGEIKDFIRECYSEYKYKGFVSYNGQLPKIMKYSHREMARKFSDVLSDVIG